MVSTATSKQGDPENGSLEEAVVGALGTSEVRCSQEKGGLGLSSDERQVTDSVQKDGTAGTGGSLQSLGLIFH